MATRNKSKKFVRPTAEKRIAALGDMSNFNEDMRRALTYEVHQNFPPIPIPNPGDWLDVYPEDGQTVDEFQKCYRQKPSRSRNLIVIQPFGDFTGLRSPNLDIISEYAQLFFPACQTQVLPSVDFDRKITSRIHPSTNQIQYLIPDILKELRKMRRKRHNTKELFTVAVTMMDIYPNPRWNFVYGEATPDEGIGIYSFSRFDPQFPNPSDNACTPKEQTLILRRAVSTYLHEVMHLFGLEHCIYYQCLMNGVNGEDEMDQQLIYLCPVCLQKMFVIFGQEYVRIMEIYQNILDLSRRLGFEEEIQWYENRLNVLNSTN